MSIDAKSIQHWFTATRQRTPALGDRELAVLNVLWHSAPQSAQQVLDAMPDQKLSLSTIQSTLERLHRKNVLSRRKQARSFLYEPLMDRQALISSLLRDIVEDIAGGDLAPMVSGFMDVLADDQSQMAAFLGGPGNPVAARRAGDDASASLPIDDQNDA